MKDTAMHDKLYFLYGHHLLPAEERKKEKTAGAEEGQEDKVGKHHGEDGDEEKDEGEKWTDTEN